jgi:hypothetical protein
MNIVEPRDHALEQRRAGADRAHRPAARLPQSRHHHATTLHIHAVLASPIFEAMPEGAAAPTGGRRGDWQPARYLQNNFSGRVGAAKSRSS